MAKKTNPKTSLADSKYCYLTPQFPKQAFVALIFLVDKESGEVSYVLPLNTLYASLEDIRLDMEGVLAHLRDTTDIVPEVPDILILLPASFYSLYQLKRRYWRKGGQAAGKIDRNKAFWPVADNPALYMLLATPAIFDHKHKEWEISAALPLPLSMDDEQIEKLIINFDYPVEEKAKYAALYSFGKPLRFNWRIGKTFPVLRNPFQIRIVN